ncbi:TonB-dependent receptor [Acinetobacter sp. ANC 4910]|uniref:TonB-dependent receptor plug domain-containing protein n=1 Tax=Acinetobacter sp. ANC 4910 TaxID=2529850 RepID=UPI00103E9CCC|nr:TonB-dependent receptor [Acinetobacter sp. ANC 4910]TCB35642.1 TonB-dependent receptor [Acinetobacter sp. ANC 4910]
MPNLFQPTALVGAIAIAMGFSTSVSAQDNTNVVNTSLDTLVVTASRSEEKIENVPARISVINEKTIEQSPVTDLPTLLTKEAGLTVKQVGGYGQTASVFLRGTNAAHTLFLQDGMRSNIATVAGTNIPLFDLSDVKQIEILKGPASVQYGTDAIGGVIQLISKIPTENSIFTTIEAGERNTYKTILGVDVAEDGFYAQLRGQRFETDGDQIIANDDRKAGFDQKGYSAKVGVEKEAYGLSAEVKENKGTGDYFSYGAPEAYDFINRLYNVQGRLNLSNNLTWNTRLSQFDDQYNVVKSSYPSIVNTEQQEIDSNLKWQFAQHQNILFGVEYNETEAEKVAAYIGDTGFKSDNETIGYYVQHQFKNDLFSTQAGVRVEDNQQFGTHTVGQLAARYFATPKTSFYTNVGTAFRAPVVGQIISEPSWWGGNPDLKPEESISYELGFDHSLNYGIQLYGSVYQTKVDNLMVSDASTGFKFYNLKKATFTGSELGLKWKQDNLFANAEYAYVQPKNDDTDEDAPNRPRQNFTLSAGWDNGVYGFTTSLVAKGSSKDIQQIPGYATIDMNAYWQINPHVKVFSNIHNLGDTTYKAAWNNEVSSYYLASGRLATAGVTFRY